MIAWPVWRSSAFVPGFKGFAPMPQTLLPFKTIVAASSDDPWCALPRAQAWASAWGAHFHDVGPRGHINAESGLGDWMQGRDWLFGLTR